MLVDQISKVKRQWTEAFQENLITLVFEAAAYDSDRLTSATNDGTLKSKNETTMIKIRNKAIAPFFPQVKFQTGQDFLL